MTYITTINSNGIRIPKEINIEVYQWKLSVCNEPFINTSCYDTDDKNMKKISKQITGRYITAGFLKKRYNGNYKKVIIESVPGFPGEYYIKPLIT